MRRSYTTPWKKSRTYGDIYGGRARRRMTDNIFYRAHSLQRPSDDEILPIVFQDNPSRDYFFPATAEEVLTAFEKLPDSHRDGITHIWLRRSGKNKNNCDEPLAEFICGSGVRVIVLYAWPTDGVLFLGKRKPQAREVSHFLRFGGLLQKTQSGWIIFFEAHALRRFYLEFLLCHEVGHHLDWYHRHWSKANIKKAEEAADQYAYAWGVGKSIAGF